MAQYYQLHTSADVLAITYAPDWMEHIELKKLISDIKEKIAVFEGQRWALYDDIRNWPIKIPEHMSVCADSTEKFVAQGMSHCVVCVGSLQISEWMMKKIMPEQVDLQFMQQPNAALSWLQQQGFDVSCLRAQSGLTP